MNCSPGCVIDDLGLHTSGCVRAGALGLPTRLPEADPTRLDDPEPNEAQEGPAVPRDVTQYVSGPPAPNGHKPNLSRLCVACGREHVDPKDPTARKVGMARIAQECAWVLDWPGMDAHQVIHALEEWIEEHNDTGLGPVRDAILNAVP